MSIPSGQGKHGLAHTPIKPRLHIVGAGWAGLSAAIHATLRGWQVLVYEAAPQAGGRARGIVHQGQAFDNGQHLMLGAYHDTLALMQAVGVDTQQVLARWPLHLCDAHGQGLRLRKNANLIGLVKAVLGNTRWRWLDRLSLLGVLGSVMLWRMALSVGKPWRGTNGDVSVSQLCALASEPVMRDFVRPLCLAALNAPTHEASALVFSRVLMDAFSKLPASCDFLLPRVNLSELFATPATQWLQAQGAILHFGHRIQSLSDLPRSKEEPVILATSAWQAAHLTREICPAWSACTQALTHYPIATVYVSAQRLGNSPSVLDPVVMLESSPLAPAQFAILTHFQRHPHALESAAVHDHSIWAFVVSDSRGLSRDELTERVLAQARHDVALQEPKLESCIIEKRATFAPLVGQTRPHPNIVPGVWACGDYVLGPYPSTLEGAVLSGKTAVNALTR